MTSKVTYCYEVSAEAEMAYDTETGAPTSCYLKIELDATPHDTEEESTKARDTVTNFVARTTGLKAEWLKPISQEEYDANQEDESE